MWHQWRLSPLCGYAYNIGKIGPDFRCFGAHIVFRRHFEKTIAVLLRTCFEYHVAMTSGRSKASAAAGHCWQCLRSVQISGSCRHWWRRQPHRCCGSKAVATKRAFALCYGGDWIITWGHTRTKPKFRRVQQLNVTDYAFAAILADGSVVTWGEDFVGGESSAVQLQLRSVQQVQGTYGEGICCCPERWICYYMGRSLSWGW